MKEKTLNQAMQIRDELSQIERVIMKKNNNYAEMGLRAIKRAAQKAYEDARRHNLKVPIWRNNRVEYIDPSKGLSQKNKP